MSVETREKRGNPPTLGEMPKCRYFPRARNFPQMAEEESQFRVLQCIDSNVVQDAVTCARLSGDSINDTYEAISALTRQGMIVRGSSSTATAGATDGEGPWELTDAGRRRLLELYK
ncbi:MAG: hypothetical protein QOG64_269 [Acidimicrobiaceae bacterium]|nr:hypothetical protein [Acidimicrobiaceae bacterium]